MDLIKSAVSTAATAELLPKLPDLPPDLLIAWSMFSVVKTPKMVGTPVSLPTDAIPLAD